MAKTRAIAYNPLNIPIPGTENVGPIYAQTGAVSIDPTLQWWNSPDENLGYLIAYVDPSGDRSNAPERILGTAYACHIGFFRSEFKTEVSFVELARIITGSQSLLYGTQSKELLNNMGYWTSYQPARPYSLLEEIATYLRTYMNDFKNPNFYAYQLDGDGTYISDGGGDMYDGGNFTTPWLLSGTQYTSNNGDTGSFPNRINYTNTTETIVDTDFYYVSLGYQQFTGSQSATYHPLTVLGSREFEGPVGWQVGGNSGADGGGTLASGMVINGTQSNGFTTYAFYRQTYNAVDPSHCSVVMLLGHSNWSSVFGPTFSFADPTGNGGNGIYLYTATASNILAIQTLLSKNSGAQVTANEIANVVHKFTQRIKEALGY